MGVLCWILHMHFWTLTTAATRCQYEYLSVQINYLRLRISNKRAQGGKEKENQYRKKPEFLMSTEELTSCTKWITNIINWKTVYLRKNWQSPKLSISATRLRCGGFFLSSGILSLGSPIRLQQYENTAAKGRDSTRRSIPIFSGYCLT